MLILRKINEIHISILKGYFRRRIKRKIDWRIKKSIIVGMFYTCFQLFERIYTKIKFHNFLRLQLYLVFNIISLFCIFLIIPFVFFENFEEEKIVTTIITSKNERVYKKQLEYYNYSHLKSSNRGSISIITDNLIDKKLNFISLNSLNIKNAGGKSQVSEAYSINHISEFFNINNAIYEKQITYWCTFKMIDYILYSEKEKLGVSVVRAFSKYGEFSDERSYMLLKRKISSLLIARRVVSEIFEFNIAILHIICENLEIQNKILKALNDEKLSSVFNFIDCDLKIWISVTNFRPIFTNKLNT